MVFGKREHTTEHRYVEDRLSAYLDGELSTRERGAVERHLSTCRACQWQLNTLRQTVQWTRELPSLPAPRAFTLALPARTVPAPAPRRRLSLVPVMQGATALVALLLVFAVAGEFMLTGFPPALTAPAASAPAREALQAAPVPALVTQAAVTVQEDAIGVDVAEEVQLLAEAQAPEVVQTPEAAFALEAQPETEAVPEEPSEGEGVEKASAPPPPGLREGVGAMSAEPAGTEPETEAMAESEAAAALEAAAVEELVAAEQPAPPPAASPAPDTPSPTLVAAATVLARAEEQAVLAMNQAESAPPSPSGQPPAAHWVRLAQLALGVTFLLLGSATFVVMSQRRRGPKSF
jgi:anti-sigma factor RsiW